MPKNHRTQFSLKLVLSLIAIVIISWIDSKFFGTILVKKYSLLGAQMAHLAVLVLVGVIGYYNWKDYAQSWLKNLWVVLYVGILVLLGVLGVLYLIQGAHINNLVLTNILRIRNAFTSPLPFFAFYLLTFANKAMAPIENEKT